MAYVKQRSNGRYTAIYRTPSGDERSAGTYDDPERAQQVAEQKELFLRTGSKGVDPETKATTLIRDYAPTWLANHRIEPSTKAGYRAVLNAHIVPQFGSVRVAELQREAVRAYLTTMQDEGYSVSMQRTVRSVLSAMMQTAWDDGYRSDNPVRGLRVQRGTSKDIPVMRTEEFGRVWKHLPSDGARALARLIVMTGCRFGEAVVLRPMDLDVDRSTIRFRRALQDVGRENHPDGKSRFYIAPYTKDHGERTVRVDKKTLLMLTDWIEQNALSEDDLLFSRTLVAGERKRQRRVVVDLTPALVATLGTVAAPSGKEYQHGTWNAYITAKCRCTYCRQAFTNYRWERLQITRTRGHAANPSKTSDRFYDADSPYLYDGRWLAIWKQACQDADLPFQPTAYQLRHTHASWLIENGEDPKTVMVRLGHKNLATTSRYVHAVTDGGSAADIMSSLDIDWDVA